VLREYVDVDEFGAKELRPQLNELMAASRKRLPVRLIVTPRTTAVLISRYQTLQIGLSSTSPISAFIKTYRA